jgi:hypothetical protein
MLQCRKPPPERPSMPRAEMWLRLVFAADQDKKRELALRIFALEAEEEPVPAPSERKH